jgi:hypothetical protein
LEVEEHVSLLAGLTRFKIFPIANVSVHSLAVVPEETIGLLEEKKEKMTEKEEGQEAFEDKVRRVVRAAAAPFNADIGFPTLVFREEEEEEEEEKELGGVERDGDLKPAEVERVVKECRILITDMLKLTGERMKDVRVQVMVVLEGIEKHKLESRKALLGAC